MGKYLCLVVLIFFLGCRIENYYVNEEGEDIIFLNADTSIKKITFDATIIGDTVKFGGFIRYYDSSIKKIILSELTVFPEGLKKLEFVRKEFYDYCEYLKYPYTTFTEVPKTLIDFNFCRNLRYNFYTAKKNMKSYRNCKFLIKIVILENEDTVTISKIVKLTLRKVVGFSGH
jgi:hypothetical protein